MVHAKILIMNKILKFILKYLSSLFDEYGFSIMKSNNSGNRFSGASILLASDEIEIFIAVERDEITAQFRSVFDKRKNNWYSAEVVLALFDYKNCNGVLDDRVGSFIKDELSVIINRFRKAEM